MATLSDIAKEAGVSRDTASRVLNGSWKSVYPKAEARAQRVRAIARRLGYRPHAGARAIARGRFGQIAMLTRAEIGDLQQDLNKGAYHAAAERDLHLTYAEIAFDRLTDADYSPKVLQELCVDGLIVHYAYNIPRAARAELQRHNLPAVWVNTLGERDCVYPDDVNGAFAAVNRLVHAGHRQLGYVDDAILDWRQERTGRTHYSAVQRRQGFMDAAAAAGLSGPCVQVKVALDPPMDELIATYAGVLQKHREVTAWVCGHERVGNGLALAAVARGLRVPRDLSIVAFANAWTTATATGLGLSRLLVPMHRVGQEAVAMLCRRVEHGGDPQPSVAVPYQDVGSLSIAPPIRCDRGRSQSENPA